MIELVDRSELGDIQYLKNRYLWLIELNDYELSNEVMNTNNVQNALMELLEFADEVMKLPIIKAEVIRDKKEETFEEWLKMN